MAERDYVLAKENLAETWPAPAFHSYPFTGESRFELFDFFGDMWHDFK